MDDEGKLNRVKKKKGKTLLKFSSRLIIEKNFDILFFFFSINAQPFVFPPSLQQFFEFYPRMKREKRKFEIEIAFR